MSHKIPEYDYIVLGAGSGGLLVAVGLEKLGKNYLVISENIGGDCTHYGCVPSKTLLHLAREYSTHCSLKEKQQLKHNTLENVRTMIHSFVEEENTLIPGDKYVKGTARFISGNTVEVIGNKLKHQYRFRKKCIIATGSSPKRTTISGLSSDKIITNEEFFYLENLPKSVTILGAGPIGAELATACAHFRIPTYLVSRSYLPSEPEQVSKRSLEALQKLGVQYIAAKPVKVDNDQLFLDNGSTIPHTDYYISAIGRKPNTELNLEAAQVLYDEKGIDVSENLETSNRVIYAIGDCTNNPQFTHLAAHHGKYVLKKIAVPFARQKKRAIPRVTFTDPPVASVEYVKESKDTHAFEILFSNSDRGRIQSDKKGYGLVYVNLNTGAIVGVSMIGAFVEELISLFTLIIDEKIPLLHLTGFITPYPTYANIIHRLTVDYLGYLTRNGKQRPLSSIHQLFSYLFFS